MRVFQPCFFASCKIAKEQEGWYLVALCLMRAIEAVFGWKSFNKGKKNDW